MSCLLAVTKFQLPKGPKPEYSLHQAMDYDIGLISYLYYFGGFLIISIV